MSIFRLFLMLTLSVFISEQAIAEGFPETLDPARGTDGFSQNYSDVKQELSGSLALINQMASDGSRNDSFVSQIGTAGGNKANIEQRGDSNKNYSFVNQNGGGNHSDHDAKIQQKGSNNTNSSLIEQGGVGTNNVNVKQGFSGSDSTHTSEIHQTNSNIFHENFSTVTQNGGIGTENSSYIDQDGNNTATVSQGHHLVEGAENDSLIMQTGSNTAIIDQGKTTVLPGVLNMSSVTQSGLGGSATVTQN